MRGRQAYCREPFPSENKTMKRTAIALGLLAGASILASSSAFAGGSFQTLPGIGYPAYCASTVSGTGSLSGITGTGQGTTGSICGQTVPAGPTTFLGSEVAPFDLFTPGTSASAGGASAGPQQTAFVNLTQLAQGAIVDLTTVASTTMGPGTVYLFVDGTDASAYTITLPANPVEGQFAVVVCTQTTVGNLTIAANAAPASTTLKPSFSAAACTAGTSTKYRYGAAANAWFKV
jgi:hypothetical protein